MHNYGSLVRLLIYNNNKNILTKKQDIRDKYKLTTKDVLSLIDYTKNHIPSLGMELVGIDKGRVVDPMISEKYSIRRKGDGVYIEDRRVYIVYTLLLLEGDMTLNKMVYLCKKIHIFNKDDIENYIRYLKKDGYINIVKEEDEYIVEKGYRYYMDIDGDMIDEYNTIE